jgi:adenylate kinase family enzyme
MTDHEPRRFVVVGCGCAGKTTLARELAARIDGDHIELDSINNLPGWRDRDRDETRRMVAERLRAPKWVVDGNYTWLADDVWPLADRIVILDPPRRTVVRRAVTRSVIRVAFRLPLWNGNRETWPDLLSADPARSMIVWTWQRQPFYRREYRAALARGGPVPMVHLVSPRDVRTFLRAVPARQRVGR